MPSQHPTRRQVLRALGSAATAATAGTSGCVDGILQPRTRSSEPSPQPAEQSATPGSPSGEATPTQPASDSTPYLSFSAIPAAVGVDGSYRFTSVRPDRVAANQAAFGAAYVPFAQRWLRLDHVVPFADQELAVSVRFTTAIVAEYQRDRVERYFEDEGLEYLDSHRGVSLYGGMLNGYTQQVVGVGDAVVYLQGTAGLKEGRRKIEHLIDLQHGETTPYYEQSHRYDAVTSHLPQGAYTRVHPRMPIEDPWISEYDVVAAGETLLFETDRHPAEGRTVLQYPSSVSDPLERTDRILAEHDRLIQFPMTDPTLRQPAPGTIVVTDSVDPEDVF